MRKLYTGENIDVSFDPKRCIHAAECVKNLPSVFDTDKRPWISTDNATANAIAKVVEMCPSGALEYNRKDGVTNEYHDSNEIIIGNSNEIYLRGEFTLKYQSEEIKLNRAILKGSNDISDYPFYTLSD